MTAGREIGVRENERLASLETGHLRLVRDVESLSKSVRQLADDVRGDMGKIMSRINEGNRTQWPTLASWAAVILVIIGMMGSGYIRDQARHETMLGKQVIQIALHERMLGHPGMLQRVEILEKNLQHEIDLIVDGLNMRLDTHDQKLVIREAWFTEHSNYVAGLNATQTTRLKALERKVFGALTQP